MEKLIKEISSLEDLCKEIKEDKKTKIPSSRRYIVRFIFLNSFESLKQIVECLKKENNMLLDISKLLPKEDGWVTSEDILYKINEIVETEKENVVVFPLSEILRFFSKEKFASTINKLSEIENKDIRLYIPLVGLWERFKNEFWDNFHRKENWVPIWKLKKNKEENDGKIKIFQVNFHLEFKIKNPSALIITTTNEWLNLWNNNNIATAKVISSSHSLNFLSESFLPDDMFELEKINNQKDYLEKIYNIRILFEFKDSEKEFWNKLIDNIQEKPEKIDNINTFILSYFNRKELNFDEKEILNIYYSPSVQDDKKKIRRWLLKNFLLQQYKDKKEKELYLYNLINNLNNFDDITLISDMWLEIFKSKNKNEEHFSERRELLSYFYKNFKESFDFVEEKLEKELLQLNEKQNKDKIRYLTNITLSEKKYVLKMLKESADIKKDIELIKEIYPEIYYYLNWDTVSQYLDPLMLNYFKEYNLSKITNRKSDNVNKILSEINHDKNSFCKWYYNNVYMQTYTEKNSIWLDGIGIEWLPLLIYFINKYGKDRGKFIEKINVLRVNIPTTTECNRYNNVERIDDMDKYIHKNKPYKYPDDIIKEIELLKDIIIKKILQKDSKEISIISDHGFSFLCQSQFGNIKRVNFEGSEHDGRCLWINKDSNYEDDEYFMNWDVNNCNNANKKCIVALKHVSLNKVPMREVHGGATPEEVLVPHIKISSSTIPMSIEYEISQKKFEISVKNRIIEFSIDPSPDDEPELKYKEEEFEITKKENLYTVKLDKLRQGNYNMKLKIGDKEYSIEVTIRGGYKEQKLF